MSDHPSILGPAASYSRTHLERSQNRAPIRHCRGRVRLARLAGCRLRDRSF